MQKLRILIPVILALFLISSIGLAKDDIMPLSQLKPRIKGIGKSVFEGTEIEGFNVEIVGIMNLGTRKLIVAKLSGKPKGMNISLEETGVISAMSGSPVYINGKNIGAIAFSFGPFHLEPLTAITPIESMLKIEKPDDSFEGPVSELPGTPFFVSSHPKELRTLFEKQGLNFKILPMGTTGISTSQEADSATELKPGSSINIVVMEGDIMNFELIGTLTYIDGPKIYGLGHQIFNIGNVSFPFYLSKILTVFPSRYDSYKIFEKRIGEPLGTITLDRSAGVMGILGKKAEMIPLKISFQNKTELVEFNEKIANCKYSLLLMQMALETALKKFFNNEFSYKDPNSDITLKVHLRALVKEKPEIRTVRYFVIPGALDLEFFKLDLENFLSEFYVPLFRSRFPFEFEQITFDIEILEGKKAYGLDKAFLTKNGKLIEETPINPGDTVELSVVLKNADTLEKSIGKLTIPIPENISEGIIRILINDSMSYDPQDPFVKRKMKESLNYPESLEELIKAINEKLDENKLYIQIIYPEDINAPKKEEENQKTQEKTSSESKQDKGPTWQSWKKVEDADKLPVLKDEKPSEFIKQITIPLELEGMVWVTKELRHQIKKLKPKPIEAVKKKQPLNSRAQLLVILIAFIVVIIICILDSKRKLSKKT